MGLLVTSKSTNQDIGQAVELITSQKELLFSPGSVFTYSNANYALLADLIEKVSGLSYSSYVKKHIFEPMQMVNSEFYGSIGKLAGNVASAYVYSDKNYQAVNQPLSNILGDGGLFTSVDNLLSWNKRLHHNNQTLFPWTTDSLKRAKLSDGSYTDYAAGLWITGEDGNKHICHRG